MAHRDIPCFAAHIPQLRTRGTKHHSSALAVCNAASSSSSSSEISLANSGTVSRRAVLSLLAAAIVMPSFEQSVQADDISGQVTLYRDLPKGFTMLRPNGWNEFEATPEAYDIKWQDVIQPLEFITVLVNPIAKDKSLSSIGSLQDVGQKLAKSRSGKLLDAKEKDINGIPAYVFEISKGNAHQITLLTVNKSKLYSVNASSGENRWSKRQKLLRGVVDSFQPKL